MSLSKDILFSSDIQFAEKHIGGTEDDTLTNFNNQINLIENNKTNYERLMDYNNKLERDKNKNDDYIEKLDNELHATVYRINNFATFVDDINYSNPIIFPKSDDPLFKYRDSKNINSINTQIIKKKEYLNIDSSNRIKNSSYNIDKYYDIKDYGLEFENDSNFFNILIDDALKKFKKNDSIILRGFKDYSIIFENLSFFFKNGSKTVILDIKPNYSSEIPYYDVLIKISNVVVKDNLLYWKNIPLRLLNQLHKIKKIEINNDSRLSIELPIEFYTDNSIDTTLNVSCEITFLNLGNYPISLINSNVPISSNNLNTNLIVNDVKDNYIQVYLTNKISLINNISIDGFWSNDKFFTGTNIQIGKIDGITQGYPNSNSFVMFLNKTYTNVAELKITSSEIPNIQTNIQSKNDINKVNSNTTSSDVNLVYITNANNKLYWENIIDVGIYFIELESGNYDYQNLKQIIEEKVSKVKRNFIFEKNSMYQYNMMTVNFNINNNETTFNMYNMYNLPECLIELFIDNSNPDKKIYIIKIKHFNHNLNYGDTIYINNSKNYFVIDEKYINDNNGHIVRKVINENVYEIILTNINEINDVGNTYGGNSTQIKTFALFRLYFDFQDTFGSLIGFKLPGNLYSITNYANSENNYKITNLQPYYYDIEKILIVNNISSPLDLTSNFSKEKFNYILLLLEGFNNNNNPNGPTYFYKFLLNGLPNSYLFNTFVNSPVYFNPPIKYLNQLKFTFINPNGGLSNFGNLDYSLTMEVTTLNNIPENTNIATYISRL